MAKKQTPRSSVSGGTVKTLADVARHFGRSLNTVAKGWRPNWGPDCGRRGAWDLAAIERWRAEAQSRAPDAETTDEQVSEARRRKQLADARIKEADAARRERLNRLAEAGVVFREDVETFLAEFFRFLRDGLKGLIEDVQPEFPRAVREQLADSLRQRTSALLRALKTQAERLAELDDAA